MERIVTLKGEKVSLVVPEKQDIELWYEGMNNLEIGKNLVYTFGRPWLKEDEEDFYEIQRKRNDSVMFSIYLNEEKEVIGNIALNKIDKLARNAEFGIVIFKEDKLGKGYGTEAVKLILKYAFEIIGLHKVYGRYVDFNKRGGRAYEKVGFKKVGVYKDHEFIMGEYFDQILIEIMRDEFLEK